MSFGYHDSEREGVTRATIGQGTVTVGGESSDGEGINRDISRAEETTKDESTGADMDIPMDLITDPGQYLENVKNSATVRQIAAFAVGDGQYLTVNIEGISKEQRDRIVSGETKVKWENHDGNTYIILDSGERFIANYQSYSYDEIMANPELMQGFEGASMNGIMNHAEDAIRNGLMQTGQGQFMVAYDPTYALVADLIEVGYNKFVGGLFGSANINNDNAFMQSFLEQNPNAILAGHSAGGTRLYLATQNDVEAFENSYLQWFGAPVNEESITNLTDGILINRPIVDINSGDFVGNVLGRNANGMSEYLNNTGQAYKLFIPSQSPHSNYLCLVCDNYNKK